MKNMKLRKLVVVGLAIPALFTGVAFAAGDAYDPLRTTVGDNSDNILEYVVEDGAVEINSYLAIAPPAITSVDQTRSGKWLWCTGLTDPYCDPKNSPQNMKATSILPPCADATSENCIDSVEIGNSTTLTQASLIRSTKGITFPPSPEYNYIGASTTSLWNAPGTPSASGSTTYSVMPRIQSYFRNGKFDQGDFFLSVVPYREVTGNYQENRINPDPNVTPQQRYLGNGSQYCAWAEAGLCGIAQDFAADTRIKVKIRLPKEIGGWFRGRLADPAMEVTSFSANNSLVSVEANPVKVARMAFINKISSFNDQEKVWFENFGRWGTVGFGTAAGPQAGLPEMSFPFIELYRTRVKDTAVGTNTFWNYTTTSWGNGSNCLQDKSKVLGIVTTNALAYDGSSPSFENQTLNYRVSGLHFMPDGVTPVQGSYNLVMRSDTARCLYGFTNAPVKATISIVGGGDSPIATVVAGEKNGWLSLSANGFTFSEKTLQVKLSQDVPAPVATPTPSATPTTPATAKPVAAKKTSITCVKGKTSKKVTAVNPKCPSGYRKK
jgi:hypothetical protein